MKPMRSVLYVPARKQTLGKVSDLHADCYVIDLEDSVPLNQKSLARKLIQDSLGSLRKKAGSSTLFLIRVNSFASGLAEVDLKEAVNESADGVMLVKVE